MTQQFIARTHIRIPITWFVDYVGSGLVGTGVIHDFSLEGWRITAIESRPIQIGMYLVLSVTLPNQSTPIKVEAATVQWVNGCEFGVHVVRISAEGEARLARESVERSIN